MMHYEIASIYEASYYAQHGFPPLLKLLDSGLIVFVFRYEQICKYLLEFNNNKPVPVTEYVKQLRALRSRMHALKEAHNGKKK